MSIAAPDEFSDDEFGLLEFFVVRLYSKIFNTKEVNEARHSFFHGCKDPPTKNIPPTKEALRQRPQIRFSIFKVTTVFGMGDSL